MAESEQRLESVHGSPEGSEASTPGAYANTVASLAQETPVPRLCASVPRLRASVFMLEAWGTGGAPPEDPWAPPALPPEALPCRVSVPPCLLPDTPREADLTEVASRILQDAGGGAAQVVSYLPTGRAPGAGGFLRLCAVRRESRLRRG